MERMRVVTEEQACRPSAVLRFRKSRPRTSGERNQTVARRCAFTGRHDLGQQAEQGCEGGPSRGSARQGQLSIATARTLAELTQRDVLLFPLSHLNSSR